MGCTVEVKLGKHLKIGDVIAPGFAPIIRIRNGHIIRECHLLDGSVLDVERDEQLLVVKNMLPVWNERLKRLIQAALSEPG